MARDDDRDRDPMNRRVTDDSVGRFLWEIGGILSGLAAGREGRNAFEEGMGTLAPNASPEEISAALEEGILLGMSFNEKRKALRQYHEEIAEPEHGGPLVDTTIVENEAGETTALRVLVSDPDARVYDGPDHVLVLVDDDTGATHRRELEVPFDEFTLESADLDNITEFTVRRTNPGKQTLTDIRDNDDERKKVLEESADNEDAIEQTGQEPEEKPDDDDVDLEVCVLCGAAIEDEPWEHHQTEHPGQMYDPKWYDETAEVALDPADVDVDVREE